MTPAIAAATRAAFADRTLTVPAIYQPAGGPNKTVRAFVSQPDAVIDYGGGRLMSPTRILHVRVEDLPDPRPGQGVQVGGAAYVVNGEPVRDATGEVWRIELRET